MSNRLVVLGWHNVDSSYCFPSSGGRGRTGLVQQLRLLRRLANVVPLRAALQSLAEGRPLPARAVAVTFDDGYRDNLTVAGPILRELDIPATCFVVPDILSRAVVPWWEKLAWTLTNARADQVAWEGGSLFLADAARRRTAVADISQRLKRRDRAAREAAVERLTEVLDPPGSYPFEHQFLDWDGARQLRDFMDLESHSLSHAILAEEPPDGQRRDLAEARRQIEDRLEVDTSVLAYPNGGPADYGPETVEAARAAGYSHAVTTIGGVNTTSTPPFEILRTVMNPERGGIELLKVVRDAFIAPLTARRDELRDQSKGSARG